MFKNFKWEDCLEKVLCNNFKEQETILTDRLENSFRINQLVVKKVFIVVFFSSLVPIKSRERWLSSFLSSANWDCPPDVADCRVATKSATSKTKLSVSHDINFTYF